MRTTPVGRDLGLVERCLRGDAEGALADGVRGARTRAIEALLARLRFRAASAPSRP